MDTSSVTPTPNARKLAQTILQRLASVKNEEVGRAIGKDHSTVSRISSGEAGVKLNDIEGFLSALGLKVVDVNKCCVDREVWGIL
jgi:hypothetical protein